MICGLKCVIPSIQGDVLWVAIEVAGVRYATITGDPTPLSGELPLLNAVNVKNVYPKDASGSLWTFWPLRSLTIKSITHTLGVGDIPLALVA